MTIQTNLDELAQRLMTVSGRSITAIAGPPAAGKSTVADALVDRLNALDPKCAAVFPMDGYHFDDMILEARGQRSRKGAPFTFDVDGYRHMLMRLRAGDEDEVAVPVFDRNIEIARAGARIIPNSVRHIITEGNYLLLDEGAWRDLGPHFDRTVYIEASRDLLLARLEHRWQDMSEAARRQQIDENDMPNVDLVRECSRPADFMFPSLA